MVHVLVIGYAPAAVDFTDPLIPPGLDEATVAEGITDDIRKMHNRGWEAEHLPIWADDQIRQRILDRLSRNAYDCIVIGGGVRMTTRHVRELEIVVNAVREGAPHTPIAFNSGPNSSGDAAARWLPPA
ncbi:MAG: hypothetical protein JO157_03655 [Acetobacteraceae bacterium]|nr:hypothetical protein [Acetobacteraceae bacterium]